MIPWLEADDPFPPVEHALRDPNGLLAAGDELSTERLRAGVRARDLPLVRRWRSGAVVESRPAHGARDWRAQGVAVTAQDAAVRPVPRHRRHRLSRGDRRLRRAPGGAGRHLDHPRVLRGLLRAGAARRGALDRGVGRRHAGRRALRRRDRARVLRRVDVRAAAAMPRRWRSCTWSASSAAGASRSSTARCPPRTWPRSAARTSAAPSSLPLFAATCRRRRSPAPWRLDADLAAE